MITQKLKNTKKQLAATRVRAKLHGTATRPRLSVHLSLKNVSAQLINDDASTTIAAVSTLSEKSMAKKTMSEKAQWVGEQIAIKAKSAKIDTVVFDRGSKQYHGRVQLLAEAARKAGLTI